MNLRGTSVDFWTAEYARMFPARAMPAIPRADRMSRALLGQSAVQLYLHALAGPRGVGRTGADFLNRLGKPEIGTRLLVMLSITVALVLVFPRYYVSVPPGRGSRIAELVIPGSSRAWLFLGGAAAALVYAAAVLLIAGLVFTSTDPTFASSLQVSYGIGDVPGANVRAWLLAMLAALYALNAAVVWRAGRQPPAASV